MPKPTDIYYDDLDDFGVDDGHLAEEPEAQPRPLTLQQFCSQIRHVIESSRLEAWVVAEVASARSSRGHWYIELVQKSESDDRQVAQLRCAIWASQVAGALMPFRQATGGDVEAGMKILAYIRVTYSEVYGMSGNICYIDPAYTLGDMEARRKAIVDQLRADGVFDMNRAVSMPQVIRRIAVVSAATAAGYGDFCHQLEGNAYGLCFQSTLFESIMQGERAEASVVHALERIADRCDDFDVVVVIRGGGSRNDLACFDSYEIASCIAQFPLPVITGIGHERDVSIADLVANTSVKTPTAVAEFIIGVNVDFLACLDELYARLRMAASACVARERSRLDALMLRAHGAAQRLLTAERYRAESLIDRAVGAAKLALSDASARLSALETRLMSEASSRCRSHAQHLAQLESRLFAATRQLCRQERMRVEAAEARITSADPRAVLRRGFSLTTDAEGKRIASAAQVKAGDVVTTHLSDGKFDSTVK